MDTFVSDSILALLASFDLMRITPNDGLKLFIVCSSDASFDYNRSFLPKLFSEVFRN